MVITVNIKSIELAKEGKCQAYFVKRRGLKFSFIKTINLIIISCCYFAEYGTEKYHLKVCIFRAARLLYHVQPIMFLFSDAYDVTAAVI